MTTLYLIIHEKVVHNCHTIGVPGARQVLTEIARIKKEEKRYHKHTGPVTAIDPKIPPPSDDLQVLVTGAFTELCLSIQKNTLREKGYNVAYHLPACLSTYIMLLMTKT